MAPFIHYMVKGKLSLDFPSQQFQTIEKIFSHENPLVARTAAFAFYQNYVEVLLNYKGKEYHSHEDLKADLCSFFTTLPPGTFQPELAGLIETELGIGVYLVINRPLFDEDLVTTRWCLHGVGCISNQWEKAAFIAALTTEYCYYEHYGFEKGTKEIMARYANDAKEEVEYYAILDTPYNWTSEGHSRLGKAIDKEGL